MNSLKLGGQILNETLDTFSRHSRNREEANATFYAVGAEGGQVGTMGKIDLVGGYRAGALEQPWIEGPKLSFNHGQRV